MAAKERVCLRADLKKIIRIKDKEGKIHRVRTTDISTTGIGFNSPVELKEGEDVTVFLRAGILSPESALKATVVRSRLKDGEQTFCYFIGTQFVSLAEKQIRMIEKRVNRLTNLSGMRHVLSLVLFVSAAIYALRFAAFYIADMYRHTEFGNEWVPSVSNLTGSSPAGYFQLFLLVALLYWGIKIFCIKSVQPICLSAAVIGGTMLQCARLAEKFKLNESVAVLSFDSAVLTLHLYLLILIVRSGFLSKLYGTHQELTWKKS